MSDKILSLKDLKTDKRNARKHNPRNIGMIETSLKQVGAARSGVIDEDDVILAGNGTYEALASAGIERVRVVETDGKEWVVVKRTGLTEEQKRQLALADNRAAELATWDAPALEAQGIDLKPWFTPDELANLKADGQPGGNEEAEDPGPQIDKAEELREKWQVEVRQLWQLGEHRLLCGDSTKREDVERLCGEEKADLMFTDPPYGVSIGAKNRMLNSFQKSGRNLTDIESDDMNVNDLKNMLTVAFQTAKQFLSDQCSVFVCSPQGGNLGMMMMMMQEVGLPVRHVLNWVKNAPTFSMGRLDYEYQHEPILFTWTKTHKRPNAGQFHTSVWTVDKPRKSPEHPTMKPIELPTNAILNHTDLGDIVYEPFSGSGTDIVACEQTGRKCRAIEINPAYVAVALQRWSDMTKQEPRLL